MESDSVKRQKIGLEYCCLIIQKIEEEMHYFQSTSSLVFFKPNQNDPDS